MTASLIMKANGLHNVGFIQDSAQQVGIPLSVACALMDIESKGRNVYGHDQGAALSGYPRMVTESNFWVYHWLVTEKGMTPNGVGPSQLTSMAFIDDMLKTGKRPWSTMDNMIYGMRLLRNFERDTGTWRAAGVRYNGSRAYGDMLVARINTWRERLTA